MNDDPTQSPAHRPDGRRQGSYSKEPIEARLPPARRTVTVTPRHTPKGTKLITANNREALFQIRCARQLWWWLAPIIAVTFCIFVVPFALVAIFALYDPAVNVIGWLLLGACIASLGASYYFTRIWLPITVDKDAITIGNQAFARTRAGGFRLGYTIEGKDMKNDYMDHSMGLAGLRLAYGPWGEDLPYLVNKYHSAEIVIWMNGIVSAVGAPAPAKHDLEKGRKVEEF